MKNGLHGKKIVLAASRKTDEMTTLIEKQGGQAIVRSLQGTVFLADKEVVSDLRKVVEDGADLFIFTTGIGTQTLLDVAEKIGLYDKFLHLIQTTDVASRGYKTYGALKKLDIKPVAVDEDGTTDGLIRAMTSYNFNEKRVVVQLHGDPAPRLIQFLKDKGASVVQLLPYQHIAPESKTVETLLMEINNNEVDAICFTTAIQVRSLFTYAKEHGYLDFIKDKFQNQVLAVAVGKVTAEALKEEGISNYLAPELERMGAMIIELSRYYNS